MLIIKKRNRAKIWWGLLLLLILLSYSIKLPYYYTQPGEALELSPFVEVEDGYKDAKGSFMLTTVNMGRANIYLYAWSKFSPYRELLPLENVKPTDETDEQYFARQRMVMKASQEHAIIVAYNKAGKKVHVENNGIRISSLIEEMPAANILQFDDRIIAVDGKPIHSVKELNELTNQKKKGDIVQLTIERNKETLTVDLPLMPFPKKYTNHEERVGLGILYPMVDRTVTFEPNVEIDAKKIGGPSAGLMFSLEIYNQLVKEDVTKGYKIAGTGEIDEDGNVGRIGGVHQKVMAAHKEGAEIFFAPREGGRENSNYEVAKKIAEEEGITMKIVGVDTFDDALNFLAKLQPK